MVAMAKSSTKSKPARADKRRANAQKGSAAKNAAKRDASRKASRARIGRTVLITALLLAIAFTGFMLWKSLQAPPTDVLVTVNDDSITTNDLAFQYNLLPQSYRDTFTKDQVLEQIIDEQLVVQAAKRDGMTVSQQTVHERIQEIIQGSGITIQELEENLATHNMTQETFERLIERQLLIDAYTELVIVPANIDDAIARVAYDASKSSFAVPEQVTVRHVLIAAQRTDAAVLAKRIYDDAVAGKDFCALVLNASDDRGSRETCGQYTFPRGFMVKEFEDASFAMKDGEFRMVQTQFGYHIIKRMNATPAGFKPFEEVRDSIIEDLRSADRSEQYRDLVAGLRAKATIKYANGTVLLPRQAPSLSPAETASENKDVLDTAPIDDVAKVPVEEPARETAPEVVVLPPTTDENTDAEETLDEEILTSPPATDTAKLLSCIANHAVLYGTTWNSDTADARQLFARSDIELEFVACDNDAELCKAKGIVGYPTWVVDDAIYPGRMTVDALRNAANC